MKKIFALILVLSILVVACGKKPIEQVDIQGQSQKTPVNDNSNNPSAMQLKNNLGKKSTFEWTATYNVVKTQGEKQAKSVRIHFQKGANMRTDVSGIGVDARNFLVDGKAISCSKTGVKWNCYNVDSVKDELTGIENDILKDFNSYTVSEDGTKEILKVQANCYLATKAENSIRYCFNSDSIPMYIKYNKDGANVELTLGLYDTAVRDIVFVPPSEPIDVPAENSITGNVVAGFPECEPCGILDGTMKETCLRSCSE